MRNGKIKVITIIEIIILFDILCNYHFFYLVKLPNICNILLTKYNYAVISAIIGLLSSIFCLSKFKKYTKGTKRFCINYIITMTFTYLLMIIYTLIKYPEQNLLKTICEGANFLHLYWVPTYIALIEYEGGFKKILKRINYICFIWYCLVILQFIVYNINKIFIFDFSTLLGSGYIRLFGLRISCGCFGVIMILYNYISLSVDTENSFRDKVFCISQLILGSIVIIYIQQTRMLVVTALIGICCCILLCKKTSKVRKIEFVFLFFAIILLITTNYFGELYQELISIDAAEGNVSFNNRIYSFSYYWECFKNNPIMGNSLVSEVAPYYNIVHGKYGIAYYSDVGLIGILGQIGMCSIVFFFYPLFYSIKTLFSVGSIKNNDLYDYNILFISLIYILSTSVTLLITDYGREIIFSFIFAFMVYYNFKHRENKPKIY